MVVAFGDLEPQVDVLLLEVGDLLAEGIDVGGRTEPGFAPCLPERLSVVTFDDGNNGKRRARRILANSA